MLSFSIDNYHKLPQNIAEPETKMKVNALCGNETILPGSQNSGQDNANTRLNSTNKTTKKQENSVPVNKSICVLPGTFLAQSLRVNHLSGKWEDK